MSEAGKFLTLSTAYTCPKDGATVEAGDCCSSCGVHFSEECSTCGRAGYHADGCAEIEGGPGEGFHAEGRS